MRFVKCMGTLGGRLYVVYMLCSDKVLYGDPRGSYEVFYMRFGKCMGTLGGHKGSFI